MVISQSMVSHQHETPVIHWKPEPDELGGGGFKHFLFSPLFGEDSQFD